jgi:hypothetical protein
MPPGNTVLTGAHTIIYSTAPDADRAFLRDVLGLPGVDVGGGWLIFGLPPSEIAVHPSNRNDVHEFYLMCDDIRAFVAEMQTRAVVCEPLETQPWGMLTRVVLPGGGRLGVYQPRHARPPALRVRRASASSARPTQDGKRSVGRKKLRRR